ncbi:MAG: hypothetical protein AB7G44_03480 [Bacteroidia bacterium]
MKKFSDFGIKPTLPSFTGEKIKISKVLNCPVVVHDFRITDSQYGKNNEKCLTLQIELNGKHHVVFTGSISLMDMIQKVPKAEFPFTTTIEKENERYEFK